MERIKQQKDLVHWVSKFGKGFKKLFDSPPKPQSRPEPKVVVAESSKKIVFSELLKTERPDISHTSTFGEVYVNELAKAEIEKDKPNFSVGSIIVREKNLAADSLTPETVIAMVKRVKGFSEETGDWEFFVFNGADLKMQKRETVGDCAKCHASAEESDWVFRDYLKK